MRRFILRIVGAILVLASTLSTASAATSEGISVTPKADMQDLELIRDSVERIAQSQADSKRAADIDDRPSRDLAAQESMAFWAMAMFAVTVLSTIVGGVGLAFVWHSLSLNRRSVEAAEAAVNIAQVSNAAQSRAWVSMKCSIVKSQANQVAANSEKGVWYTVLCVAENHGKSPATHLSFHAELTYLGRHTPAAVEVIEAFAQKQVDRDMFGGQVLFPGEKYIMNHSFVLLFDDVEANVQSLGPRRTISPLISCCLVYQTPHVTGFRKTAKAFSLIHKHESGGAMTIFTDEAHWFEKEIYLMDDWHVLAD